MSVVEAQVEISESRTQEGLVFGTIGCIAEGVWILAVLVGRFLATILLFLLFFALVAFDAIQRQAKAMYRSIDRNVTGLQYANSHRANS